MTTLRNQRGFTLTELLVSALVAGLFAAAAGGYYRSEVRALSIHSGTLAATDKVRSAMTFLSRELRDAGYDPQLTALTTAGYKGVRFAGPNAVWIVWDANQDGSIDYNATDPNAESAIYTYDSANQRIVRTVAGVDQTLVSNVPAGAFSFQYFDTAGNALAFDTAASFVVPSGAPSLSSAVSSILNGQGQVLSPTNRDAVALVRVSIQVQTVGITPAFNLSLASGITLPARILDKL